MIYLVLPWFPLKCGGGGKSGARKILLFVQKLFDKDFPPNIYVFFCIFLRIGCTVPVTSCENYSTLKNLKTVLCNKMGQERLSSLALMHIHYNLRIDFDDVIDKFKLKCNRTAL